MNEKLEQLEKTAKELLTAIEKLKGKKSDLDIMKEKYESGEYIIIRLTDDGYERKWIIQNDFYKGLNGIRFKLIHKTHKHILDAYLKDSSVEIEYLSTCNGWITLDNDFVQDYEDDLEFRLKPKEEYPIFKINDLGEIWKFTDKDTSICMLSDDLICTTVDKNFTGSKFDINDSNYWNTIPYNKERGLYHKQPIWCWLNDDKYGRSIRFYNFYKDELISPCDSNYSHGFQNIEPITPDQLKVMSFVWKMYKQLED